MPVVVVVVGSGSVLADLRMRLYLTNLFSESLKKFSCMMVALIVHLNAHTLACLTFPFSLSHDVSALLTPAVRFIKFSNPDSIFTAAGGRRVEEASH